MKKIMVFLVVAPLLAVFGLRAEEPAAGQAYVRILDVDFDYAYYPATEHTLPDIKGRMIVKVEHKGVRLLRSKFSCCHYSSPDEAPEFTTPPVLYMCEEAGGTMEVSYGIMVWGAWAQLSYLPYGATEYVDLPKIWSTDYIDQNTLDMLFAGVDNIAEDAEAALYIRISGNELIVSGVEGNTVAVRLYNLQGASILNVTAMPEDGSAVIDVSDVTRGIYVVSVTDGTNVVSRKISR